MKYFQGGGEMVRWLLLVLSLMFWVFKISANAVDLTYANFFPPQDVHSKLAEAWMKEIEKRTNGAVKFTYFPGGATLKANQIYEGVMKGVADIGMSCFAYTPGLFPAMEAIDLPLGYKSGRMATWVINEYYKTVKPKELEAVKVLYLHAHGPGLLHTKKLVQKLEDVKGLKIRSTGVSAKIAKALGGIGMPLAQTEAYEALQKGVVDATLSPYQVLKGWKQAEVIKYTVECYGVGYTTGFFVVMNKSKWEALPPEVKKVFEQVSQEWIVKHAQAWDDGDKEGKEYSLSLGNKVITLSPEEDERWAQAVKPVVDEYINTVSQKGLPGKQWVDTVRKLMAQFK
jgi:TRAP-type C4-dicarboxylate transport system substrate-binding protein